jgi:arylsulfatase A-like enzyme
MFPTLLDLAALPKVEGLEGATLRPQFTDAATPRDHPAITTHNQGNHAVRDLRWRYIHYDDGSEELYDLQTDPNEWTNLASLPAHAETKARLAKWLPKTDLAAVPGSAQRVLTRGEKPGTWIWEGKLIGPDEPIPGLQD